MPLEQRIQPPPTFQSQRLGKFRHQPYSLTHCLRETRTGEHLPSRTPSENVETRIPLKTVAKRTCYGECTCIPRDEPMPTNEAHSDTLSGDEVEETQRISPEQRAQTNENHRSWHAERRTSLTLRINRSDYDFSPPIRDISPDSSTSGSETDNNSCSSMIPTAVPMPSPSSSSGPYSPLPVPNSDLPTRRQLHNFYSSSSCGSVYNLTNSDELTSQLRVSRISFASDIGDDSSPSLRASLCRSRGSLWGMGATRAHARQVANRIIRYARENKTPDSRFLCCPDCGRLPLLPVTGLCGHTRCTKCIEEHGDCPCGTQAPSNLHVNTLIQDLTRKMRPLDKDLSSEVRTYRERRKPHRKTSRFLLTVRSRSRWRGGRSYPQRERASFRARLPHVDVSAETLMSPQSRFELAWRLLCSGQYREAAPHFARVAAISHALAKVSRSQLAQIITILSDGRDPRRLTPELYRAVRAQAATSYIQPSDLECVLCYHTYTSPVATPCGHTYCRTCIERSMDYRKSCALCLRSLDDFDLAATRETVFVCAALESIDALNPPAPPDPDVIPIFVCTVAYPDIPCPLFIFDPRYWLMIRRVLESGSRKFGMVAYERDRSYTDCGTVLEVCDCVHLEDGRSILSTVGVSRFRVIKRDVRDGCDVARIQPLTDITPTEELVIWELRLLATQISYKALLWLNSMNQTVRSEIEVAFGWLPHFDHQNRLDWWDSPDGPAWLWWLIAILPLRSEIKILILSTNSLLKRMMAVSRTLEAIDQVAVPASTSECDLSNALTADEWI